jgi:microcystin-dependent protein
MPNAGVVQTFAAGALGTTGGAAHDNMMPTIVLRFAIAYQGL